ncbi:hypothetical protein VTN02DRAFT_4752 [Thermoascus thermophilus]
MAKQAAEKKKKKTGILIAFLTYERKLCKDRQTDRQTDRQSKGKYTTNHTSNGADDFRVSLAGALLNTYIKFEQLLHASQQSRPRGMELLLSRDGLACTFASYMPAEYETVGSTRGQRQRGREREKTSGLTDGVLFLSSFLSFFLSSFLPFSPGPDAGNEPDKASHQPLLRQKSTIRLTSGVLACVLSPSPSPSSRAAFLQGLASDDK